MHKRFFSLFLTGVMFFLCSCVDKNYDLVNKEISTDVEFNDNKLNIPLGSLQAFMLDSLFSGIDIIETTEDGVYCIRKSDTLYDEKYIKPIDIKIPQNSISVEMKIDAPSIPMTRSGQMESVKIGTDFNIEQDISFSNQISRQFKRIYACYFKETPILLNLKLEGLEAIQATSANLDLTIEFPPFFKNLKSTDNEISVVDNCVHINKKYRPQDGQGITIELYCSEFNFEAENKVGLEPQTQANGSTYLSHQSTMAANGKIDLELNPTNLSFNDQSYQVGLSLDFSFEDIAIQVVHGLFNEEFYKKSDSFAVHFGDLSTIISEANSHITLAEPYIELVLGNSITLPIKHLELDIYGNDEKGELIPTTKIKEYLPVNPAKYDINTGEIITDTIKYLLTSNEDLFKEDFEKIITPNLQKWLEHIPDSMFYSVHSIIDKDQVADVRLDQYISLSAAYNVVMPFGFKELQVLGSSIVPIDLGEPMDIFSNVGLKLKMTLTNTFPLGILLEMKALDEDKNPIEDITINTIDIEPCNEEYCTLQNTSNKKRIEIGIKSKTNENFSAFKHLKLDFKIYTNEHSFNLKNTQGLQISDMAIEVSGDIKTNLNN